ncbi:MAG: hypothetical protein FWC15_05120 [Fibromonadales bacterium]|nr:hypothetical protein [Fibromonadales bacterium]
MKNCDWSTLEHQLQQLNVEKEIRDSLKNLFEWLKHKQHEDSLLAALRWNREADDRKKMIEISETLNGRIFTYQVEQKEFQRRQLEQLHRMDSMNGLYYAASISGQIDNRRAIDSMRMQLQKTIGDGTDDILASLERLIGTVANNSGGAYVEVDMSGVADGIGGLYDGLGEISDGIGKSNDWLGKLDSSLAAGNANILGYLDTLSKPCDGTNCGDYDGLGDGAFKGIDSVGMSAGRYDSLLTAPGSKGLQDSVTAFANRLREVTTTPFSDGMGCPAEELSVDACEWFGTSCKFSFCDQMFHVQGRHFLEWVGVFMEFLAWVIFLVRIA